MKTANEYIETEIGTFQFAQLIASGQSEKIIEIMQRFSDLNNLIPNEVITECQRQNNKWGEQNHNPIEWFAILSEETGELAKEVVELHFANDYDKAFPHLVNYRKELIQVAAVSLQMLKCLDRNQPEINESILTQECIGCSKIFDYDMMEQDNSGEHYCPKCWAELSPVMQAEYEELKAKGEID